MNKTAIAFSTKDRVELTKRSVESLLQPDKFDLFWMDGSDTPDAKQLALDVIDAYAVHHNVRGGADAAIVYGLTTLLDHPNAYDFIGLCENDVLLHPDWYGPTMALFERGKADGLEVGAVSARCYEDRILCQRDDYALCHNLGAGMVIFTRAAARLVLDHFRTGWSTDNRLIFSQLSGLDIARWWAFRGFEHQLTADWHFDTVLAAHGLASLALTPSPCEMIGQVPPLTEQGLTLADKPVELLRNDDAFKRFADRTASIRAGHWCPGGSLKFQRTHEGITIFPHQFAQIDGIFMGDWRLKWTQGFGPFSWKADNPTAALSLPLLGGGELFVGGGPDGGRVKLNDEYLNIPSDREGAISRLVIVPSADIRTISLSTLTPDITIYGLRTQVAQPYLPAIGRFDHKTLPLL